MNEVAVPSSPPRSPWIYGLLGLTPFVAGAASIWAFRGDGSLIGRAALVAYGGVILAFLGGARFGLEIGRIPVRASVIGATMIPAIFAFLVQLGGAASFARWRLLALAAAFAAQWAWDVRSTEPPRWYRPLRHVLSAGAIACLLVGAAGAGSP